ncbi:MAG: 4Fe-4S dicluster domain-containing protein, partial [Deltaproteobacteria bacterium]|nr:4Fe-4S dicluster domain-containing protein [Deltaproteobacteria bacterium]
MTPSRKIGVILCRCRGLIGDRLDLRELRRSLEAEEDLVFLRTAESLCDDPGPLKAKGVDALVVAGCRDATLMERSKTVLEGAPVSPWSCEFVDLKTPLSSSPLDPSASTAYVGLLIRAHMEKVRAAGEAIGGTSSPRRGGILPRAGASMSRRRFLRLPLRIARNAPHPNEVPRIDPDRCLASRISCRECGNACPFQAISFREDRPFLIEGRCEECGLCATLCPSDALRIPSFSDAQALGLLDALADPAADIGGRVLVFTCDRGNDVSGPMV